MGLLWGFNGGYTLGIAGMVALLVYPGQNQSLLSLFIMASKFGVSASYNMNFLGTQSIFPVQCVVFAFGTCAAIGHIAAIIAPEVAELEPNSIAKWAFIGGLGSAMLSLIFLRMPK